jgi:hypothetical protein
VQVTDRAPNGRFIKGQSGNPGGRKRSEFSIDALIDEIVTPDDWRAILRAAREKAKEGDLKAIELLLDRRFGKALQKNEHTGENGAPITIRFLDDAQSD